MATDFLFYSFFLSLSPSRNKSRIALLIMLPPLFVCPSLSPLMEKWLLSSSSSPSSPFLPQPFPLTLTALVFYCIRSALFLPFALVLLSLFLLKCSHLFNTRLLFLLVHSLVHRRPLQSCVPLIRLVLPSLSLSASLPCLEDFASFHVFLHFSQPLSRKAHQGYRLVKRTIV